MFASPMHLGGVVKAMWPSMVQPLALPKMLATVESIERRFGITARNNDWPNKRLATTAVEESRLEQFSQRQESERNMNMETHKALIRRHALQLAFLVRLNKARPSEKYRVAIEALGQYLQLERAAFRAKWGREWND